MRQNTTEAVKRSGKVTNCNGKTAKAAEDDERRREAADRNGLRQFDVLCARSRFRGVGMLGAYQRIQHRRRP